jgi:DNA topoisomerase IB
MPGASHTTQVGGTRKAPQAVSQRAIVDLDAAFELTVGNALANIRAKTMHGASHERSRHIRCE